MYQCHLQQSLLSYKYFVQLRNVGLTFYFKTICLIMHDVFDNVKPLNVCNLFTHSAKIHYHNAGFSLAGNFYQQYSRTDHLRNLFSSIGAINGIVFPTVIMLYQNINLRTSYRISHWIF